MKPKNTDGQAKRRKDALRGAVTATVTQLAIGALLLWLRSGCPAGSVLSKVLLVIPVLELGSIFPIWINLKIRLKEIEGGEENAAAQY